MYFKTAFIFSLVASALALPSGVDKRNNHSKGVNRRAVLGVQDYSEFQVSDGVAGNALAEVLAKFPISESDFANVDPEDLAILKAARKTAENAETETGGFNEAIEVAGGKDTPQGRALQIGKVKNKVLKLQLQVMALQIEQLQDGEDRSEKLQQQLTKLAKNVELDEAEAGNPSQSVNFPGTSEP